MYEREWRKRTNRRQEIYEKRKKKGKKETRNCIRFGKIKEKRKMRDVKALYKKKDNSEFVWRKNGLEI